MRPEQGWERVCQVTQMVLLLLQVCECLKVVHSGARIDFGIASKFKPFGKFANNNNMQLMRIHCISIIK